MRAPDSTGYYLLAIIGFNEDAYTLYPGADSAVALALRGGTAPRVDVNGAASQYKANCHDWQVFDKCCSGP
jgi:hypothetical protein